MKEQFDWTTGRVELAPAQDAGLTLALTGEILLNELPFGELESRNRSPDGKKGEPAKSQNPESKLSLSTLKNGFSNWKEEYEADILIGHLACAVTTGGAPHPLRHGDRAAHPDALQLLKKAGFDALSLADPHLLDRHSAGLYDSLWFLDKVGLRRAGAGIKPMEAYASSILEKET